MKPSGGAVYFKRYCVHSFILSSHFEKRKEKPRTKREKQKEENTTERTKSARNDSRRNVPDTRRCCFEERDVCVRGLPASPLFFSFFFLFSRSRTKRDRNAFRRDKRRTDNAFVRRKFSQEPYSSFLASFLQIFFSLLLLLTSFFVPIFLNKKSSGTSDARTRGCCVEDSPPPLEIPILNYRAVH